MDFIQMKNFRHAKDNVKKIKNKKNQVIGREKIFAKDQSDKESKIYQELLKLNKKTT